MDLKPDEVALLIEEPSSRSNPSMSLCRICHEEEEESCGSMETPCACSGSLKFAHRKCIQRWCDEKGGTLCELCLQNFEPNYTVAPKKALIEVGVTIRQSIEVSTLEGYNTRSSTLSGTLLEEEEDDDEVPECSPASSRTATYFQSIAVTLTIVLLLRDLISVVTVGAETYAFAIFAAILMRVTGILLPFYAVMRIASAIKQLRRDRRALSLPQTGERQSTDDSPLRGGSQSPRHLVQVHS